MLLLVVLLLLAAATAAAASTAAAVATQHRLLPAAQHLSGTRGMAAECQEGPSSGLINMRCASSSAGHMVARDGCGESDER
jgi:hypothetical protein